MLWAAAVDGSRSSGRFPSLCPFKTNLQSFFFGPFGFSFVVIFLVEFCDPASFSLLEAVTSSGKQSCVRQDPSLRHLAVLGGDPALSMCSCIHDKSFKNPGYWCLDTRANNPLEFFSISVLFLCVSRTKRWEAAEPGAAGIQCPPFGSWCWKSETSLIPTLFHSAWQ